MKHKNEPETGALRPKVVGWSGQSSTRGLSIRSAYHSIEVRVRIRLVL